MFTLLPPLEIVKATHAHTANPGSRTARNLLAKEAVTIIHGIEKASEAEFVANLLFPLDGETTFSAVEIISVWGGVSGEEKTVSAGEEERDV